MTLILNSILWAIILPFNRTVITVEVISTVVSDIIGSCCRSISLLCKVFKGIIKYCGPFIHNVSTDFIILQCKDIVKVQIWLVLFYYNNPNNPMLLLMDISDSPSIVEQLSQGPGLVIIPFIDDSS